MEAASTGRGQRQEPGFWTEPRPDLGRKHPGVKIYEGPYLPSTGGEVLVDCLVPEHEVFGPKDKVCALRPNTAKDRAILQELQEGARAQQRREETISGLKAGFLFGGVPGTRGTQGIVQLLFADDGRRAFCRCGACSRQRSAQRGRARAVDVSSEFKLGFGGPFERTSRCGF